jgi:Tol biopolymer transport system component
VTRFLGSPDDTTVATFVMRSDGTEVMQLTDPADGFEDWAPMWSPDGTRLMFEHYDEQRNLTAIYTVRADGTHTRRVTRWSIDAGDNADWSPNGRWMLFISHTDDGGRKNFWLVHPNGTGYRKLTHFGTRFDYLSGSFSPNGRMITFGVLPGTGDAGNADVYTMNLQSTALRNVTGSVKWESAADWGPSPK